MSIFIFTHISSFPKL